VCIDHTKGTTAKVPSCPSFILSPEHTNRGGAAATAVAHHLAGLAHITVTKTIN